MAFPAGKTVADERALPQVQALAPFTVNVCVNPAQIVALEETKLMVGLETTVKAVEVLDVHTPFEPVTVMVSAVDGSHPGNTLNCETGPEELELEINGGLVIV